MKNEGPLLEQLTHHLSECPAEFLDEPRQGQRGTIHVDAVVSDLLVEFRGNPPTALETETFKSRGKKKRNFLRLVLVASWLCHNPWFREQRGLATRIYSWLKDGLIELAAIVSADLFVTDPDRREELVRLCLAALDFRPRGETRAQAQDRLKNLGSVERRQVIAATRAKQERARKLREAMQRKSAREAAAKPMHE